MAATTSIRLVALMTGSLLAALSLAAGTASASGTTAAPPPPPPLSAPAAVRDGSAVRIAALPAAQPLRLTLGLAVPHASQEQAYLNAVQTKGSARFHHYLTAAQYIAAFDPPASSEASVVSWARANELEVTRRYPDRLLVDVQGTVGAAEKAVGVRLNTYRLHGHTYFANDRAASIPASLKGVLDNVLGLNNIEHLTPATSGAAADPPTPIFTPGAAITAAAAVHHDAVAHRVRPSSPRLTGGDIDPNDLNSSQGYSFGALSAQGHCCNPTGNSGGSPAQGSIDLYGFGTVTGSDLTTFANSYGLAIDVSGYNVNGTPPQTNSDDNLEDTLDIEYAAATANSHGSYLDTAHVIEYYAADTGAATFADVYNSMYSNGDARAASASYQSYGWAAADMDTVHNVFNNMVGTGWTLLAASGDHGAYGNCSGVSSSYPAGDPDVIAVGGTALALNPSGTFYNETAWSPNSSDPCTNNEGGSGGGCSSHFAAPSWQSALYPCGSGSRALPDIALNAATQTPTYVYFNGGGYNVWGTSIASPEMAGFTAQADSYLTAIGDPTAGNYANLLWGEGTNPSAPHDPFYDVTYGCNFYSGQSGYCAGSGYDLVTGWGSANMLQLAWMLDWFDSGDFGRPTVTFQGPATGTWYNTDQDVSWTVADTGGNSAPTGVAGFSQAWDATASDPTSEAHQGTGNTFYNGPQFPNATSGYLALSWAGNGCHTASVTAWDNMGYSSGPQTYGSLCYDTTTPTGSITIDSGAAFTKSRTVTLTLPTHDAVAGDPITEMRFSSNGSGYGAWQSYASTKQYVLGAGDGTKKVYVEYQNAAGTVSSAASDTIVVDTAAPTVTAPTVALSSHALASGNPFVKVSWTGSDSGSGIKSYTLQKSVDGGSYANVTLSTSTATSATIPLAPGHRYQFQVRATDAAGNVSAFSVGAVRTLTSVQENSPSIAYSPGWSRVALSGSSGGDVDRTTTKAASATLSFKGFSVALVTTEGTAYGSASVAVDGATATTVTTHAAATALVQVPYVKVAASGSHKLVLKNTGTGSTSRFDVDAFLVLS